MKRRVAIWLPCKLANGVYCFVPLFEFGTEGIDRARRVLRQDNVVVGAPCTNKPAARAELRAIGATADQAMRADVVSLRWWVMQTEAKL